MTIALQGQAVGGGIAIGRAHIVRRSMNNIPHYQVEPEQIKQEIARFDGAIKKTRRQLEQLRMSIPENAPTELGAFISLHLMLLNDATISREPADVIESHFCNAEWALKTQVDFLSQQFDNISDEYLRERKHDMLQVVERIFKNLNGETLEDTGSIDLFEDTVLIAHDLSPADMIFFKDHRVAAFVTDVGGLTSHTAILGRSLDLPSVIALGVGQQLIREDDWVIIDGIGGVVIVQPDDMVLAAYKKRARTYKSERKKLEKIKKIFTQTLDEVPVKLMANIETPEDIADVIKAGADGVGLFRSEFLFLNRDTLPTEDEQYEIYKDIVTSLKDKPVTIRTVDLGVDKNPKWFTQDQGMNPALGLTGIRLCLAEPGMFRTQLRALFRAAAHGHINIMIPMVCSLSELNQVLVHIDVIKEQLREDKIEFGEQVSIGTMIEIPSAALTISSILKKVDFVSIGTNDLIQYTLAVDRGDHTVSYLYNPSHPAVLKLIAHVIKAGNKAGKSVSICGEMAGDIELTRLLLAMGLRIFSVHPANLLSVKQQVCETDISLVEPAGLKIMRTDEQDKIDQIISKINEN